MTPCSASFLISYGLMLAYRVNGKDCDTEELGTAMMSCEEERETLSTASRHNDTTQLCQALQQYSECIGPKISNCNEEAMQAFNIIKQQYAGAPYHCQIRDTLSKEAQFQNDVSRHFHNDDNHIVTNGPSDALDRVTVAALPDNRTPEKRKDPPAEMKATTSASMIDPPSQDDNLPPNTAQPAHNLPPLSVFIITAVAFVAIASFKL